MKARKKTIIVITVASTAFALYAWVYYRLSLPNIPYAGFAVLATLWVEFVAFAITNAVGDRSKPN